MERTKILGYLFGSIFLIVFNIWFFMLMGTGHQPASVWVSYGFIHFAYLVKIITPALIRKGSRSIDYGLPLFEITTIYFLLALITGVFLIMKFPENNTVSILGQLTLTAIFAAVLLLNMIANEHTANNIEQREIDLKYVKEASSKLDGLQRQISDNKLRKKVENAYDLIHSSPVKSAYNVYSIEQAVIVEIENLGKAISEKDNQSVQIITDKICNLADERNRQLKFLVN